MEQLTKATQTGESDDKAIEALQAVVIGNYELKILYPELYIDHSTKKTTVLDKPVMTLPLIVRDILS